MKKQLFNNNWTFLQTDLNCSYDEAMKREFSAVNIPHDYMISHTKDLYENSIGWYRKSFVLDKKEGKRYEIYFEGVYMDSTFYVNGQEVGCWKYGYSSFFFDITEYLQKGDNELVMKIVYQCPNTRWYSGAGIYRDVFFTEKDSISFVTDSLYVSCKPVTDWQGPDWEVITSIEIDGISMNCEEFKNTSLFLDIPSLGVEIAAPISEWSCSETEDGKLLAETKTVVSKPDLWSIESPRLYDLEIGLGDYDKTGCRIGFRQFDYDVNKGLFLNGQRIKVNGVCEHHDLGAIGAAFNKSAMVRKLEILRTMGVNAVRTSHNMPATLWMDLCDEMGFLCMNEAFDMWEKPKTDFDYGNYFKEWYKKDVRSWIRRDRNHPCIFLWSIGNEIYDTHAGVHGEEITRYLLAETIKYDPRENAKIGIGSNYMPWEGAQNCADILKYAGYNYAERLYDEHHAAHPDWHIFGSETSSTVQSRGIYHFPYRQSFLSTDDQQCSGLGNCTSTWGAKNSEYCITQERDHEFSMGQFLWSGFDYIGEPTPYHTRNCYFGQIDTAGFPKDTYYIYKSGWTDVDKHPFVHLFPYWDFSIGQQIDLRAATNAPCVELFVNGSSMGKQYINHAKDTKLTGDWTVTYEPGEIVAVAYDENGKEIARDVRKSFGEPAKIVLKQYVGIDANYSSVKEPTTYEAVNKELVRNDWKNPVAGSGDLIFVEVSVVDASGNPVENDNSLMEVSVKGAGYLTGLDNGDSTDEQEYKGNIKRLFSGKMLIVVAVGSEMGDIEVSVASKGLESANITIPVRGQISVEGSSYLPEENRTKAELILREKEALEEPAWIRKIALKAEKPLQFTEDLREIKVEAVVSPKSNYPVEWQVITESGIVSHLAEVSSVDGNRATIVAKGDGEFIVRAFTKNGRDMVKCEAILQATAKGLGDATRNPYELIYASVYSYTDGEVGNGIDHGISSGLKPTIISFDMIDFGDFGSDEITLPLYESGSNPFDFEIWEGVPGQEGSEKLADCHYHKQAIWNVYQAQTYKLSRRIKGVKTLSLKFLQRAIFQGFSFTKLEKAYQELDCLEKKNVNGDSYLDMGSVIKDIGNNVTVSYGELDFGDVGADKICLKGYTKNPVNTIHLLLSDESGTEREIIEFPHGENGAVVSFDIKKITGKKEVSLVFLPGSHFDLESIRFEVAKQ